MTPQEKAKELVYQFMEHTVEWDKVKEIAFDSEFHAKQCALIAVDEILETIWEYHLQTQWWQEVKQEIEKL